MQFFKKTLQALGHCDLVAQVSLLVGVLVLPLFFLPNKLSLEINKLVWLTLFVFVAFICWVIGGIVRKKLIIPKNWVFVSGFSVLLIAFISAVFSSDAVARSLWGVGFELDTVLTLGLLLVLMFLLAVYFQDPRRQLQFQIGFFLVAFLLLVLQVFIYQGWFFPSYFNSGRANLIGSWNSLTLFFSLVAILLVSILEFLPGGKNVFTKVIIACLATIFLAGFSLMNQVFAWLLVGVSALLIFAYSLFSDKTNKNLFFKIVRPSLVVALIALVFIVLGGAPSPKYPDGQFLWSKVSRINDRLGLSNYEARPSFSGTAFIAKEVLKQQALLGVGPNNFANQWSRLKPAGVNLTTFWDTNFTFASGIIPTTIITTGLLGFLSWVVFIVLMLIVGARAILKTRNDKLTNFFLVFSFVGTAYCWALASIFTAGAVLWPLTFIFSGLLLAMVVKVQKSPSWELSFETRNILSSILTSIFGLVVVCVLVLFLLLVGKYWSLVLYQRSLSVLNLNGDVNRSAALLNQAIKFNKQDVFYRSLVDVNLLQINNLLSQKDQPEEQMLVEFRRLFDQASSSVARAIATNQANYLNFIYSGRLYETVDALGVQGAYEEAVKNYDQALVLSPNNPSVYLNRARLELVHGNKEEARKQLRQSIALKPDFVSGLSLLGQIDLESGDLAEIIELTKKATEISPYDHALFFQLGYLNYQNESCSAAVRAFQRAIELIPDYANAKYFLGLCYDRQGKTSAAIEVFKDIKQTNPDNSEVIKILNNLEAGKPALD